MQNLDASYWDNRYLENKTGWDIGYASTPLIKYLEEKNLDKNSAILIPGCGNAHEAVWLIKNGYKNLTLLDISEKAIESALLKNPTLQPDLFVCQNFFDHKNQYDLILEQTFFCALNPNLRLNYLEKMYELLGENGVLAGVLFGNPMYDGPPFGGDKAYYFQLFSKKFNTVRVEPCATSIPPRLGKEVFFEVTKAKVF
jgi:SAM-dependent methyltransferase